MVAKSQIKFIRNLRQKKYRSVHGLFVVEGIKTVTELLESSLEVYGIFTTDRSTLGVPDHLRHSVSPTELKQMSSLKSPNTILGVFYMSHPVPVDFTDWVLALDQVRDPGNLGTIIRLCDWFGINHLVCAQDTVDCYNPKVLQATMGSIARVHITYTDLPNFLKASDQKIYGTFMDGESIYRTKLPNRGILVMGSESHGISKEVRKLCQKKMAIPRYCNTPSTGKPTDGRVGLAPESLNVATASAIFLSELRRS